MFPELFSLGPVTLYTYGVMMALGFMAAIFSARLLAPRAGIGSEQITDMAIVAIVGGLLGAYVNYIISYDWSRFVSNPASALMFWDGGLVFLGGLIGGIVFAIGYILKTKMPLREIADIAAVSVPLAYAFGRIGCFFAGCCYGVASEVAWAVKFPALFTPRHPTQLYSALLGFGLAAFALLYRKRRAFAGQSFLFYLMLYGLGRFLIEMLRENPFVLGTSLTVAQFTGLVLMATAAVLYPILARQKYSHK